jgi:hypothetical protein
MRILVLGNSNAGSIMRAIHYSGIDVLSQHDLTFIVTPGGGGPYLNLSDSGNIIIDKVNDDPLMKAYCHPTSLNVDSLNINDFDAVVISALTHFSFERCVIADFKPKISSSIRLVSRTEFLMSMRRSYDTSPGIIFLKKLSKLRSNIIVQPFPRVSSSISTYEDWSASQKYNDPIGAYSFAANYLDTYLTELASVDSFTLLKHPFTPSDLNPFTPATHMQNDFFHGNHLYASLVMKQIESSI